MKTLVLVSGAAVRIMDSRHVSARHGPQEGRQRTHLLQRGGEQARRDGRVVQRHVLYLGEINSSQELAWRKSIEVLDEAQPAPRTLALFPEDRYEAVVATRRRAAAALAAAAERPRQWGGVLAGAELWRELELDEFWAARLPPSRKGTRWDQVLLILVVYRLLSPGSEWRLHREWYGQQRAGGSVGRGAR